MDIGVLKDLAIIILAAKLFGILARKIKVPQVVGEIIAGLLIGPSVFGFVEQSDFLGIMAEIGVIILMFSAGLGADLKQLLKTGPVAFLIACVGVLVPLLCGTALYLCFYGFDGIGTDQFYSAVFIGCIMTATSVSITVEALKELGALHGKAGTTIVSAAIIDDVIGIIVLTIVLGTRDETSNPAKVCLNTLLFFVFAVVVGFIAYYVFKLIDSRHEHTRRIPIFGLSLCFAMSYIAEAVFGVADITGAFIAGIILCSIRDSEYINEKMNISSYMLFGPVFFASIGLKTDISNVDFDLLWFALAFVAVALISKIIGCGLVAKCAKFPFGDSLKIGVGMMTRGEVALIVTQKGLAAGFIGAQYFSAVILLIMVSSIATPIILKLLNKKFP